MKRVIKAGFLSLTLLLVSGLSIGAIHEKPMSELTSENDSAQSSQATTQTTTQVVARGPRVGGMSYSNQTANLELDPDVASRAPGLKDIVKVFSFNDNPMVGYILLPNGQKINYQRSNKPAQDPDFATLGTLNNYYVILATGDLSTLTNLNLQATDLDRPDRATTQTVARGPLAGGMGYSNQTANLQVDPEVALRAPNLKAKIQVFSFNDNPMYGYILVDGEKINYQRSNKPAQDPDVATLGLLNNYYVILATGDLSKLIRVSEPIAGE